MTAWTGPHARKIRKSGPLKRIITKRIKPQHPLKTNGPSQQHQVPLADRFHDELECGNDAGIDLLHSAGHLSNGATSRHHTELRRTKYRPRVFKNNHATTTRKHERDRGPHGDSHRAEERAVVGEGKDAAHGEVGNERLEISPSASFRQHKVLQEFFQHRAPRTSPYFHSRVRVQKNTAHMAADASLSKSTQGTFSRIPPATSDTRPPGQKRPLTPVVDRWMQWTRQRRTRWLAGPATVRKGPFCATVITAPRTSTYLDTRATRKENSSTKGRD